VAEVEPGDVLVIQEADHIAHKATHKAGTYLIHHAVDGPATYKELSLTAVAGDASGWTPLPFTQVLSWDGPAPGTLNVSTTFGYPTSGTLYIVRSVNDVASPDLDGQ
jgi:hypothetical protein